MKKGSSSDQRQIFFLVTSGEEETPGTDVISQEPLSPLPTPPTDGSRGTGSEPVSLGEVSGRSSDNLETGVGGVGGKGRR